MDKRKRTNNSVRN